MINRAMTLLLLPLASAFVPSVTRVALPMWRSEPRAHALLAADASVDVADIEEGFVRRDPAVSFEYCTRCNWMLRSAWLMQEVLQTFNGTLAEASLLPNSEVGGIFRVTLYNDGDALLLWDRKEEGRFPEAAELKRAVRDILEPGRNLGHNDGNVDAAGDDEGSASVAVKRLLGLFGGLRPESKSRAEAKLRRKI